MVKSYICCNLYISKRCIYCRYGTLQLIYTVVKNWESGRIYWTSKKQTSIETSTFGSEFIAMKVCCVYIRGLQYKLRMMGIPCDFPAYVYGDNQSVLANSTRPFSVLKKKSSSLTISSVKVLPEMNGERRILILMTTLLICLRRRLVVVRRERSSQA